MEWTGKRRLAGGTFVGAGALLFGRETLSWAWDKALDGLTRGLASVSFGSFPWQSAGATALTVSGALLLLWPAAAKGRR
jgi:hypothetical protein